MKAPSKSKRAGGGGFRAAKTSAACSAACSGATFGQDRSSRSVRSARPARAEFSQRENFHHPGVASWQYSALTLLVLLLGFRLFAAEVMPPAPAQYFNDYAQVVSTAIAAQLNQTLENFEKETSNQILVAVFPKLQSDSSIEDYTVRVARAWKAGQQDVNNGAVLFVFIQDRKMYLQVGYGLEGVLPDALCKRIIEDEIKPYFKSGDYNGGLATGVNAILAAARGEYQGTGRTVAQGRGATSSNSVPVGLLIFIIIVVFLFLKLRGGGSGGGGWIITSGGGGGWSSGGGGGGGFSGGGGSFGGGGAGGSW